MQIDKDLALFYGLLLGDGCLSKSKRKDRNDSYIHTIIITCNADDKPFFDKIVLPLIWRLIQKKVNFRERKDYGAIEIKIYNEELFMTLNKLGFPIGKKGPNINIPNIFYEKGLLKYIIQGFFATDGCLVLTKNPNKYYPRIEGTSISKTLMNQITDYLINFNLNGNSYLAKRKKINSGFINRYPIYRFQFNGRSNLINFNQIIGFINPKHKEKFSHFLKYSDLYDNSIKGIPTQKQRFVRLKV